MSSTSSDVLAKEKEAFASALPEMMAEHAGEFVVFHGENRLGFFPTFQAAYAEALKQFGIDEDFLVSEVKAPGFEVASLSWALGAMMAES